MSPLTDEQCHEQRQIMTEWRVSAAKAELLVRLRHRYLSPRWEEIKARRLGELAIADYYAAEMGLPWVGP